MSLKRGMLVLALVPFLVVPVPAGAAGPFVEAAGLVESKARICGGTTCSMFGASNVAVDLSSGEGAIVTTDEYFCHLGTRGNEVFAPGACRSSKSGTVTCLGSGSTAGEVWTSRLTLSPSGELSFTKKWDYGQSPWATDCTHTYVLKGRMIRF